MLYSDQETVNRSRSMSTPSTPSPTPQFKKRKKDNDLIAIGELDKKHFALLENMRERTFAEDFNDGTFDLHIKRMFIAGKIDEDAYQEIKALSSFRDKRSTLARMSEQKQKKINQGPNPKNLGTIAILLLKNPSDISILRSLESCELLHKKTWYQEEKLETAVDLVEKDLKEVINKEVPLAVGINSKCGRSESYKKVVELLGYEIPYLADTRAKYCMSESTRIALEYMTVTAEVITTEEEDFILKGETQMMRNERLLQIVTDKQDWWTMIQFMVGLHASGQEYICKNMKMLDHSQLLLSNKRLETLKTNHMDMINFMVTSNELLSSLKSCHVLSKYDYERVQYIPEPYVRNIEVLHILRRKTNDIYDKFKDCLQSNNQPHIAKLLEQS